MGAQHSRKIPDVRIELVFDDMSLYFDELAPELRAKLDHRLEIKEGVYSEPATAFDFTSLIGKPKSEPRVFDDFHHFFASSIRHKHLLPRGYKFFGDGNHKEILRYLLRYNAFFMPAVTVSRDQDGRRLFSIKTLDPDYQTWYSRVVTAYDPTFPRVNVTLDADSLDLLSYEVFVNGEDRTENLDEAHVLRYLLVLLCYFAEVVHALVHIFDVIMVTALLHATQHDDVQSMWAQQFADNMNLQYLDAKMLLFSSDGNTNSFGFYSTPSILRPIAKDLLTHWLHLHRAADVIRSFLFSGIQSTCSTEEMQDILDSGTLLAEWRKHAELLPDYYKDLKFSFNRRRQYTVEVTDDRLKLYMLSIGDHISTIYTLQSCVELMGAFALLHGNTLSMTRLLMTPSIFRYLGSAKHSREFTEADTVILQNLLRTVMYLETGRYFFSNSLLNTPATYPLLRSIVNKYDGIISSTKMDYYLKLTENEKELRDYGWIMTDYCPDGVDGKQITLSSYV